MKTLRVVYLVALIAASIPPSQIDAIDLANGIVLDMPAEKMKEEFGMIPPSNLTKTDMRQIASYRFAGDTLKVLAIPVEWSNRPGTYSTETLDSLLFSQGVYPGGSMADYFYENSYGQLVVTGDVLDWYFAGEYDGSYDFEPILDDLDASIDYTQYDGDYDGNVDAVIFIRSGTGEEDSQDPWDIWSYAYIYGLGSGPGPYDGGMHVPRWNTSPELRPLRMPFCPMPFSGEDTLNRIRVFCHETTHNLGLPDLYDYDDKLDTETYYTPDDYNDHPMMDWCLMGYYGYGIFSLGSDVASHLCGWSKKALGWNDPEVIGYGEHNDLVIYDIETHDDSSLYMIPVDPDEGEYFLLEFRNRRSSAQFDKLDSDFSVYLCPDLEYGCDSLDLGLMITHVHDSLVTEEFSINDGTPNYPHYSVAIEDMGYNPTEDYYSNPVWPYDTAQWWYPYETRKGAMLNPDLPEQQEFGPSTYPSSDGYSGSTGIIVWVDSIVDEKLYAYVYNPVYDAPVITGFTPGTNEQNVALSSNVTVTFDESMDGGSFTSSTFMIYAKSSGYVSGTYSYNDPSMTVTFDPDADFMPSDEVTVTITTGVLNSEGGPLENDTLWTFYTGVSGGGGSFLPAVSYDVGSSPAVAIAADFDGDGDNDLATANYHADSVTVLLNNGDGTFGSRADYFTAPYPGSICTADFDGDGDLDLMTSSSTYNGLVYLINGNGDGTFQPVVASSTDDDPIGICAADLDCDGDVDVATANYAMGTVSVLMNTGSVHFATHVDYSTDWGCWTVYPADLDGDGDVDLVTANASANNVSVLFNNGNGTFASSVNYVTEESPTDVRVADVNGDGRLDLVVSGGMNHNVAVHLRNTDGTYAPFTAYSIGIGDTPGAICAADFDGDGDPDVATPNIRSDDVSVLQNDGTGAYTVTSMYLVGEQPYWINAADFDGDGDIDLVTADDLTNTVSVLINDVFYVAGDANGSSGVDIDDPVFLIDYIFMGGPSPDPMEAGDATHCVGIIDIDDVVYLITYIFAGGPAPCTE